MSKPKKQTPLQRDVEFWLDIAHDEAALKRMFRRLVREAVTLSYGPRPKGDPQFLKAAAEGVKLEADRIAKELVP